MISRRRGARAKLQRGGVTYPRQREATTGRSLYRSNSGILRASEMHCRPLWVISGRTLVSPP